MPTGFYGSELARIHHLGFGDIAHGAAGRLVEELRRAGHDRGTVVDLGSGSGILAREVLAAGYEVVGVDLSEEMVAIARRTAPGATFHHGSVLDFAIPRCVAVSAVGEVLNYATDPRTGSEQLERLLRRVRDALVDGGIFLLDLAGPGRHDARAERFVDGDRWAIGMRPSESDDGRTLERSISVFTDDGGEAWQRIDEHHRLRLYEPAWVEATLRTAGFGAVTIQATYGESASSSTPASGWAIFVATA